MIKLQMKTAPACSHRGLVEKTIGILFINVTLKYFTLKKLSCFYIIVEVEVQQLCIKMYACRKSKILRVFNVHVF